MSESQKVKKDDAKLAVVIPIERRVQSKVARRGFLTWVRTHWLAASAALAIGLPMLASCAYLLLVSDRYTVEVKFAVRGQETPAMDALGIFGMSGGNLSSDSYILVDFIRGRTMFETVSRTIDLTKIYTSSGIDYYTRLSQDATIDEKVEYWRRMVTASFEPATGIIHVGVSAFERKDALDIANAVTSVSEALVNRLSTESRRDALRSATLEVERAEQRQRLLRTAMRKFREREQISDPAQRAGAQQAMIEKSRAELTRLETELQTARGFMKDDAPSIVVLKNQRDAILKQLANLQEEIGRKSDPKDAPNTGEPKTLASMLSSYEELEAERIFAEKLYLTALASLERARAEADRKQRFLAIFETPALPEESSFPKPAHVILTTLVAATMIWALGIFVFFGIREHN